MIRPSPENNTMELDPADSQTRRRTTILGEQLRLFIITICFLFCKNVFASNCVDLLSLGVVAHELLNQDDKIKTAMSNNIIKSSLENNTMEIEVQKLIEVIKKSQNTQELAQIATNPRANDEVWLNIMQNSHTDLATRNTIVAKILARCKNNLYYEPSWTVDLIMRNAVQNEFTDPDLLVAIAEAEYQAFIEEGKQHKPHRALVLTDYVVRNPGIKSTDVSVRLKDNILKTDSLDINFIWVGSEFTDLEFTMLEPKPLHLRAFFAKAYHNHIKFNLWVDREMAASVKEKVFNIGVEIHDIGELYADLAKLTIDGKTDGKQVFSKEEIYNLRRLVTLEAIGVGMAQADEIWSDEHKNKKSALDIATHNPALAADILRFILLLLQPRMYIDIGLNNIKFVSSNDSIEHAKDMAELAIRVPLAVSSNYAINTEGKIRKNMVFSGISFDGVYCLFDLMILVSTSHPKCKELLIAILRECIEYGFEDDKLKLLRAGTRTYGSGDYERGWSFTGTAFVKTIGEHLFRLSSDYKEREEYYKTLPNDFYSHAQYYASSLRRTNDFPPEYPCIFYIADLNKKIRHTSPIPDYNIAYDHMAKEEAHKRQFSDAKKAITKKAVFFIPKPKHETDNKVIHEDANKAVYHNDDTKIIKFTSFK